MIISFNWLCVEIFAFTLLTSQKHRLTSSANSISGTWMALRPVDGMERSRGRMLVTGDAESKTEMPMSMTMSAAFCR